MALDRRRQRQETKLLQSEFRWLQKARFALFKVNEARAKLAESRGEDPESVTFSIDERPVELGHVREAVEERIEVLDEKIKARRMAHR